MLLILVMFEEAELSSSVALGHPFLGTLVDVAQWLEVVGSQELLAGAPSASCSHICN